MDYQIDDEFLEMARVLRQLLESEAPVAAVLEDSQSENIDRQKNAIGRLANDGWLELIATAEDPASLVGATYVASQLGAVPTLPLAGILIGYVLPLLRTRGKAAIDAIAKRVSQGSAITCCVPRVPIPALDKNASLVPSIHWDVDSPIVAPHQAEHLLRFNLKANSASISLVPLAAIAGSLSIDSGPDLTYRLGRFAKHVSVPEGEALGAPWGHEAAQAAASDASARYLLMLSAQAIGGAREMMEKTIHHLTQREQFGKPLATFQVLRHKVADMHLMVENARALLYEAAWRLGSGASDAPTWVAATRIYSSRIYIQTCATSIQCHGGAGYTWDSGIHVWYRNALGSSLCLTDTTGCRRILWDAVQDGPASRREPTHP